jgi:hypothetical protein
VTFRIDLPRRLSFALGTLCASAERTVHMLDIPLRCVRLDRDRDSLAARSRHDSGLLVVYHTSTAAIHPSAALGRISILLRAGRNFDAFAAVMTSGKNPHAKPTATYMYSTRRLMSDGLDREQETLVYCANSELWQLFLPCLIPLDYDFVIYAARKRHQAHASV